MSTTEVELAEEIQQISELGHLVGWWTAAELIEQAHQQFDQELVDDGELLSVFQLARLRLPDLQARALMTISRRGPVSLQAGLALASRERLVSIILGARS